MLSSRLCNPLSHRSQETLKFILLARRTTAVAHTNDELDASMEGHPWPKAQCLGGVASGQVGPQGLLIGLSKGRVLPPLLPLPNTPGLTFGTVLDSGLDWLDSIRTYTSTLMTNGMDFSWHSTLGRVPTNPLHLAAYMLASWNLFNARTQFFFAVPHHFPIWMFLPYYLTP